ncbi:MAG: peroxiredoxin family protein [Bacteroidota bacterium]
MKKITLIAFALLCLQLGASAQKGLTIGQQAPLFSGTDQNGKIVDLKKVLKTNKSVVLFFYRGQWCPYCNKHIKELQDSLQLLTGKNAYVIGITPETKDNINATIKKTNAAFSMIQDSDDSIMKAYGVNFRMDDDTFAKYKTYGVDLEANNGNARHTLPVPATYIISPSGKIKFVHFDSNYQKRASVKTLLAEL